MTKTALPEFEGQSVRKSTLRITRAGDGLSEALAMAPKAYHAGDEVFLVLKAQITQINHRAEKDSEDLIRVHTAEALEATEVHEADVKAFLAEAAERTRLARDRAAGQENLDLQPSRVAPES